MAIELSTAGVSLQYAVEVTAGERPTTGYAPITGIKSIPSLNPAPDTIETTDLSQTEFKTYIDGLKDLGGALEFTANLTQELQTLWDTIVAAYVDGKETEIQKANYAFSGLFLEEGDHTVEFYYELPGIKLSVILTGIGILIFITALVIRRKRKSH